MLTSADWARMAAGLAAVRGDNEVSITIRRGNTTLAAQKVRVARHGSSGRKDDGSTREVRSRMTLLGETTMDIQPDDRFDIAGQLYRVTSIRSNKRAGVMADIEAIE